MFQVRIHGRGGQGVVTAAELLSVAAFLDGLHAQAIPNYGPERMGAPVTSWCRIDHEPIRSHEPVVDADAVIVLDPTLLLVLDVFEGLEPEGYALINSARSIEELGLADMADEMRPGHLLTLAANQVAKTFTGRSMPNTALLGGISSLCGVVTMPSVHAAISRRFPGKVGMLNIGAANLASSLVQVHAMEAIHA